MLELYKNIKKYRQKLGITQQELAVKAGYKDKSMIAKIEKGLIDLPQSKIITFADIFEIEPSELMGLRDYFNGSDGKGNTELERFRNSLCYKDAKNYSFLSEGFELMLKGIYDVIEEVDIDDITYYKLSRGDYNYYIEYSLLETLESRVAANIRLLIKDFSNDTINKTNHVGLNAAHNPEVPEESPDDSEGNKCTDS